jgi:hypothetical protein
MLSFLLFAALTPAQARDAVPAENHQRADFDLQLTGWSFNTASQDSIEGQADVSFSVSHFVPIWGTEICWATSEQVDGFWGPCHFNEVDWVDGGGVANWGYQSFWVDQENGFSVYLYEIHLDAQSLNNVGLDPFQCNVEYKVKFKKGGLSDSIFVTIPCLEDNEKPDLDLKPVFDRR